jgi:predicted ArsR family transcriptional regulator
MSVLERLLQKVEAGGTMEVGALAAELCVSPAMIEAMLDHLGAQGLVRLCQQPGGACRSCGFSTTCPPGSGNGLRLWQRVDGRGRDAPR